MSRNETGTSVDAEDAEPAAPKLAMLRARRIETMISVTPLMMLVNVVNAVLIYLLLSHSGTDSILFPWAISTCFVATLGLANWIKSKRQARIEVVSERGMLKAAKGAAILGFLWGVLPALLYPHAEFQAKLVIIAATSGMLGGGALALYVVPPAMTAWLFMLVFGSLIGLVRSGNWEDWTIAALLIVYATSLLKASHSMSQTFASNVMGRIELAEKSETIAMLLKDYTDHASDWLWESDANGRFVRGREEFCSHLKTEIVCINPGKVSRVQDDEFSIDPRAMDQLWGYISRRESFHDVLLLAKKPGACRWVSLSGKPQENLNGEFTGYRGFASDVTETKLAEERIAYLAHNDALTGLANRTMFTAELESRFEQESVPQFWAVMFLDLDGFKHVNDNFGHGVGDKLLTEVALRLKQILSDRDMIARLGGDEFAVLTVSAESLPALTALAEKIIQNLSVTYEVDHHHLEIGVSIGIAIGFKDGREPYTLLNNADLALYRAKAEGKGTFRFYKLEMDEIVKERRSLERDLREALKNDELYLCFQPLVSSKDHVAVGFEALIRWNHPVRGHIGPAEFVPIAERMGLISNIGDWVVKRACSEASSWPENLSVAVNLSPQQFQEERIVKSVTEALLESGLDPARLELEITEGLLIDNTREVIRSLRELKNMGVSIALDDFGTGYSSLSYLLKFPFDKLKVDRSFITSIDTDEIAQNVMEAIVRLAEVLDLTVTVEGVETSDQLDVLKGMKCQQFQGYAFGRPMIPSELPGYLLRNIRESNTNSNVKEPQEQGDLTQTG